MSIEIGSKILIGCHMNKILEVLTEEQLNELEQEYNDDFGEFVHCWFGLESCFPYFDGGEDLHVGFEVEDSDDIDWVCTYIKESSEEFESLFGFKPTVMSCPNVF